MHWIDNADSYICPVCRFETNNPNRYESARCPKCGFQDEKDNKTNLNKLVLPHIAEVTFYKTKCPDCGWENSINDLAYFCPKCGKNLKCGHLVNNI